MSNSFDFDPFKAQAIDQLRTGVPLSGKDVAEKALDDLETK